MRSARRLFATRAHPYDVLFGRWSVGVAIAVVVAAAIGAFFVPPETLGVEICWVRTSVGLPCPGCGLTRAVCRLAGGQLVAAAQLHPFSLLVLPFALVSASSPLWPAAWRRRLRKDLGSHRSGFELLYGSLVLAFVAYGVLRAAGVALGLPVWHG